MSFVCLGGPETSELFVCSFERMRARCLVLANVSSRRLSTAALYAERNAGTVFSSLVFDDVSGVCVLPVPFVRCLATPYLRVLAQERLPSAVYKRWKESQEQGTQLPEEVADVIATALKDWAIERGVGCGCHRAIPHLTLLLSTALCSTATGYALFALVPALDCLARRETRWVSAT